MGDVLPPQVTGRQGAYRGVGKVLETQAQMGKHTPRCPHGGRRALSADPSGEPFRASLSPSEVVSPAGRRQPLTPGQGTAGAQGSFCVARTEAPALWFCPCTSAQGPSREPTQGLKPTAPSGVALLAGCGALRCPQASFPHPHSSVPHIPPSVTRTNGQAA